MLRFLITCMRPVLGSVLASLGLDLALPLAVCPQAREFTASSFRCHICAGTDRSFYLRQGGAQWGANEVRAGEGSARGFRCLLNRCWDHETFPTFKRLPGRWGERRTKEQGQDRERIPGPESLTPCPVLLSPWHTAAPRKYLVSHGSRGGGDTRWQRMGGVCSRFPPGRDQAAAGAGGLVLPGETCPDTRRLPAARPLRKPSSPRVFAGCS